MLPTQQSGLDNNWFDECKDNKCCVYTLRHSWYSIEQEFNALETSAQTEEAKQTVRTWLIYSAIVTTISVSIISFVLMAITDG